MTITERNIQCVWDGTLTGMLVKSDAATNESNEATAKIICIHGWLDNLNSMLPLAQKLVEHHPNYEIYVYDRAGHGFSSHIPRGFDYSDSHHIRDVRTIIQTLGWDKKKFSIIGHSYGTVIGLLYAATYPAEVSCIIAIDSLIRSDTLSEKFFEVYGTRIDAQLQFYNKPSRNFDINLTFEKALSLTKITRPGLTDEAAKLLTERSIRRGADGKMDFTRDESLKLLSPMPALDIIVETAVHSIKASILFIGTANPQWPRSQKTIDLLKEHHPHFEMALIDGPHHLHMTHVDAVADRIEQYFNKYFKQTLHFDH